MFADPKYKPLPVEAVTLLQEGQVDEAIKSLRQAEALGRGEAKRRVEAYLASEPLLRAQLELRQRAAGRRFFLWFLVVDVVITAGVIYWFFYRESI
jgi:hypothetical protein